MDTTTDEAQDSRMETWEIQVPGKVTIWKKNRRSGEFERATVAGVGPKMVHLTEDDRRYNEEIIPEENKHLNPFTNGSLARREGRKLIGITNEQLGELLELSTEDAFGEALADVKDNELSVRRLLEIAERDGQMWQVNAIKTLIDDEYRAGGTQRTVQEMYDEQNREGGEILSS